MASHKARMKVTPEDIAEVKKWWEEQAEGSHWKRKQDQLNFTPCFDAYFEIQEGRAEIENYITKRGDGDYYNARAKIVLAEYRIKLYFSLKEKGRL